MNQIEKRMSFDSAEPIPNLIAKEYEDPRDASYLDKLRSNKGFDQAMKNAMEYGVEREMLIEYMSSCVRVSQNNMSEIYSCFETACVILGVSEIPKIYVQSNGAVSASTVGSSNPIVIVSSGAVDKLNNDELLFLVGREIGHVKSNHAKYRLIGDVVLTLAKNGISAIPIPVIGDLFNTGLESAFLEWMSMSQITGDHAGLLVCKDLRAALSCLAKIGGYPQTYYDTLNIEDFIEQAIEFDDLDNDRFNKTLKAMLSFGDDFPSIVSRAKELMLWVQSGEYARILTRSSTWFIREIARLEELKSMADIRNRERKLHADHALAQHAIGREAIEMLHNYGQEKKGVQKLMHIGKESMRQFLVEIDADDMQKKQDAAEKAQREYELAVENEQILRDLYQSVPSSIIEEITNQTLGDLPRIPEPSSDLSSATEPTRME